MIFTVTLYPALDKVSVVRDFEVDGVSMTERSRQSPGGQGIQISSVLQGLGARTVAMGLIGGAAGDWIRDQLDLMGVPNDFTFTAHETRTNLTILDPDNDTCTRILEPGQPVTAERACTIPSPGTIRTLGATSTLMPKARRMQPAASDSSWSGGAAGFSQESSCMLPSMAMLKSPLTAICRSWTGRKFLRSSRSCPTMKIIFITKVNCPSVTGKRKLST